MSQHDTSHPAADPASPDDPLVGTLIAGRYRVTRRLGEGGMGTVYQAVHEALRKPVALKVLSGRGSSDKEMVARFEREAVAAANLRHPNIAEATDFGRLPDGAFFLVMEYVEGATLRALLRASPAGLPPDRALGILRQVAAALSRAHAVEIVHRDLKPENVIVFDRRDAKDAVKVIDFGIARVKDAFGMGRTALTAAGAVFGTPEYMAPEQVLGKTADARADQYAFGVMAFELLTGRVPFTGLDLSQILMKHVNAPIPSANDTAPHLPPAAGPVLGRLLAKRPEDRYPTIEEACQALETALAGSATGGFTVRMDAPSSQPSAWTPAGTTVSLRGRGADAAMAPPVQAITAPPSAEGAGAPPQQVPSGAADWHATQAPSGVADIHARQAPSGAADWHATQAPSGVADIRARQASSGAAGLAASLKAGLDTVKGFLDRNGKNPVLLLAALGAAGVMSLLVVGVLVWRVLASPVPAELDDALDDWEDGAYGKAEPVLKTELEKKPALATEAEVVDPLAGSVHDGQARDALLRLLHTTALGRSAPLAARLADIGLQDAGPTRNGALKLLRGRLDLLPREVRVRIALRDADDCAALQEAVSSLPGAGGGAEDDAERHRDGECRKLLRREELCGCPPPGTPRPRGKKGGRR